MKISSVKSKFVVSQMRLDGSFHLSDGLEVRKLVSKSPYGTTEIKDVSSNIYCPGIFKRNYVKSGIPFLGGGDIQKQDLDSGKYLREKNTPNYEVLQIKKGWSLVTCGGTIGDTVFANNLLAKCWISQHVMRVIPQNIKEGMLYAYLASKYGKLLLTTNTYGSVIPTLNASNIANLPIPRFPEYFQQEVDNLVQEAARLREEATCALEKAKDKVSKCCNNEFDNLECSQTNIVSVSSIVKSFKTRLDPPVYINKGVAWSKRQKHAKRLGDLNIKIWYPGIFKRAYVKNGLPYIKGSSVFNVNPFKSCDHLSKARTPQLEELWLKEGMLLISCAGACGLVKMITKEYEDKGAIGSPDIIRLISNDELCTTEYLYVYLQLQHVYDFMQSLKYGSVIERFDIGNVKNIPIVIPSKELSEEITAIVRQYMDCTYRAFNAEEKAIRMVEQEIEKWNKH